MQPLPPPTHSAASSLDTHSTAALHCYLSLPPPRLVLDLRPTPSFAAAHIAHSTHIHPLSHIKARYSCLPPRTLTFLVIAHAAQRTEVRDALNGCTNALFLFLFLQAQHDHREGEQETTAGPSTDTSLTCRADLFFSQVEALRLLRSFPPTDVQDRTTSSDDWPALLFRPSSAVKRLVESNLFPHDEQDEHGGQANGVRSVLDLGCGAGRDLAWILYGSPRESAAVTDAGAGRPSVRWRGVGLDSWKAVLTRSALLMDDLNLSQGSLNASTAACDALVWARCTDDGYLQPLVGTGKGKTFDLPPTSGEDEAAWTTFHKAGLSRLCPLQGTTTADADAERGVYDLVLSIRFYPSALMKRLRTLIRPGGAILVSHFTIVASEERSAVQRWPNAEGLVIDYDSPGLEGRLGPHDAEQLTRRWDQEEEEAGTMCRWKVQQDLLEPIEDGRIVRSVVLRRLSAMSTER